jgi:hypothetical protein
MRVWRWGSSTPALAYPTETASVEFHGPANQPLGVLLLTRAIRMPLQLRRLPYL